jgi:hypothetical protein
MKRIIIDVNAITCVLNVKRNDLDILRDAVLFGRKYHLCVIIGGQLAREYYVLRHYANTFAEMRRSGRLVAENDVDVDSEENEVKKLGVLVSDDPHIIALARFARVRLLCSYDEDLHADFKNRRLINSPRGRVYLGNEHNHLLRQ